MLLYYYSDTLLISWVLMLIFGGYMLFGKNPSRPIFKPYIQSRRILGIGYMLFSIMYFLQWKYDFRDYIPSIATGLNLSSYYLIALCFGISFISLLDNSFMNKKRIIKGIIKWLLFTLIIVIDLFLINGKFQSYILICSSIFFIGDVTRIIILFFRTYHQALNKMENYYSDNIDGFVRWLIKSVHAIIIIGLSGGIITFLPKKAVTIYAILGIIVLSYVFFSLINYLVDYEQIEIAIEDNKFTHTTENEIDPTAYAIQDNNEVSIEKEKENENLNKQIIENYLPKWIKEKKFLQQGITIEQLCREIGTNRTYLSSYINTEKKCTFRHWIAQMRIDYAKDLMLGNSDITIGEVGEKVGYSEAHFVRLFTQFELISPAKWRQNQNVQNG